MLEPPTTHCTSDRELSLLHLGELTPAGVERVRGHLADCPRCARALADLEADVARYETVRPAQWERLIAQLPSPADRVAPASSPPAQAVRWLVPALAAALLGAALLIGLLGPWTRPPNPDVHFKGRLAVEIIAKRKQIQFTLDRQSVLQPSDALRFRVTTESAGYLSIFSLDGTPKASPFYPSTDPDHAAEPLPIEQAGQHLLPGSIILDDAPGPERIVIVFSRQRFDRGRVHRALRRCLAPIEGAAATDSKLAREAAERCALPATKPVVEVFVLAKHRITRGPR